MKTLLILAVFCATALALPQRLSSDIKWCDSNVCKLPKCACSEKTSPISGKLPQLVVLSFDDSAVRASYDDIYKPLFYGRKNPDGCPISGTFYIPHEYTDYEVVNELYNNGFEIGSHSITKNPLMEYWQAINETALIAEMAGQKTVISKFANIPIEQIAGARIPLFQFNKYSLHSLMGHFKYDNSWPTRRTEQYFPYTLDYQSSQDCHVEYCQTTSVPGLWEIPIIDWIDMHDASCNKILACDVSGTTEELTEWMKKNFLAVYTGASGAPFSIVINSGWFAKVQHGQEALKNFLDYLGTLRDVFMVSASQAAEWRANPVDLDKYSSCPSKKNKADCKPVTCELRKDEDAIRYMRSCVPCPPSYPWLYNPEGK